MPDGLEKKYPQPSIWDYLQWVRQTKGWMAMRDAWVGSGQGNAKQLNQYNDWYENVWKPENAKAFEPYAVPGQPVAPGQSPEEQQFQASVAQENAQARKEYMEIVWAFLQDQVTQGLMTDAMATEGYRQQYYQLFPESAPDKDVPSLFASLGLQSSSIDLLSAAGIGQARSVITPRPIKTTTYYANVQTWLKQKQNVAFDAGDLTSAQAIQNMRTAVIQNLGKGESMYTGVEPRVGVAPEAQALGVESVTPEYFRKQRLQASRDEAIYQGMQPKPMTPAPISMPAPGSMETIPEIYKNVASNLNLSPGQQRMFDVSGLFSQFQSAYPDAINTWMNALFNPPRPPETMDEAIYGATANLSDYQSRAKGISERYWATPEELLAQGSPSPYQPSEMELAALRAVPATEQLLKGYEAQRSATAAGDVSAPAPEGTAPEVSRKNPFQGFLEKYPFQEEWLKTPPTWRGARLGTSRSRWFT